MGMTEVPGRKYVLKLEHPRRGTLYWLGGTVNTSTMALAAETPYLHLAARLTALEAEDALGRQGQVMAKQGWKVWGLGDA